MRLSAGEPGKSLANDPAQVNTEIAQAITHLAFYVRWPNYLGNAGGEGHIRKAPTVDRSVDSVPVMAGRAAVAPAARVVPAIHVFSNAA